jgi:hypothetical protein
MTRSSRLKRPAKKQGTKSLADSRLMRDGLPAGAPAAPLSLPLAQGEGESRGRRVLLVFSDPACGPCTDLAPQLGRLHETLATLHIVMVSRGVAEEEARMAEHQLTFPVALQRRWEIVRLSSRFAIPVAYLIDESNQCGAAGRWSRSDSGTGEVGEEHQCVI